jgi:hypothetical protein
LRTLGPRDTLLYLAIHAAHHHGLHGALWMVDFLACLRAWPQSQADLEAAPPPAKRSLWYCLEVLQRRGQDPVPAIREAIRPRRLFPGEGRILAAVGRGHLPEEIRYAFTLMCLPTWRLRAVFLRQLLLPPPGVHTQGFRDGAGTDPGWRAHLSQVFRLIGRALRGMILGKAGWSSA